jgi:phage protein D
MPNPNETATFWLSQTIQAAHLLDGLVRRGAIPELPQYPDTPAYMLRRLADQLDAIATQNRRAA